jgi:hypothetical protein
MGTVLFLPFRSLCFLFYFLALLRWLKIPTLCWTRAVKGDIIDLSSPGGETIKLLTVRYYTVDKVFCKWFLQSWGSSPIFCSISWQFLWKWFCQMLFLQLIWQCDLPSLAC